MTTSTSRALFPVGRVPAAVAADEPPAVFKVSERTDPGQPHVRARPHPLADARGRLVVALEAHDELQLARLLRREPEQVAQTRLGLVQGVDDDDRLPSLSHRLQRPRPDLAQLLGILGNVVRDRRPVFLHLEQEMPEQGGDVARVAARSHESVIEHAVARELAGPEPLDPVGEEGRLAGASRSGQHDQLSRLAPPCESRVSKSPPRPTKPSRFARRNSSCWSSSC